MKVFLTGGISQRRMVCSGGAHGYGRSGRIFVDKAFIGVDGVHATHGLTTDYPDQAAIHQAMLKQARQKIAVADHSKIGVSGTNLICPPGGVDLLITDRKADEKKVSQHLRRKAFVCVAREERE